MDRKSFLTTLGFGISGLFGSIIGSFSRGNTRESLNGDICSSPESTNNAYISNPTNSTSNYDTSLGANGSLRATNQYGSMAHPPFFITSSYTERFYFPPNFKRNQNKVKKMEMNVFPLNVDIAHNVGYSAWTFDGQVPGPILRATVGDELHIKVRNSSPDPHSLHFHGSHDPNEDGWEPIPAFGERTYKITAGPVGMHPYHCHVPPLILHTAKGLFGTLLVDPIVPRKPAHEFVLIFSGWDTKNKGRNDYYTWNGVAGIYDRYPMKVPVGERVRFYIQNLLERDSVFTFHLHAQTFDIIRNLGSVMPDGHSDVVTLGPTERAVIEFTLPKKGRYMFHPHQTQMAENGGMGWIVAV
ncbi:MAG: multicopper oxidase domain-containing protein [Leptospira sp.]|nr:multicopper oxidase domain-containing protein [Leptospira sp.]